MNPNFLQTLWLTIIGITFVQFTKLDQDNIGDTVSFRCPECSKCLTCKKSHRSTAVSLQEAQEQVIVEQIVKICEDNNKVIAK